MNQFDAIVIGGSVHMGKIRKGATRFISKNREILLKKRVGLFARCYTPSETEGFIETLFQDYMLGHAVCSTSVGGIMDYEKMNFVYRKLFQSLKKSRGSVWTSPSLPSFPCSTLKKSRHDQEPTHHFMV